MPVTMRTITRPMAILLETTKFDVHKAKKFGELVTLFEDGVSRPPIMGDEYRRMLVDLLNEIGYDPSLDNIIVSGTTSQLVITVGELVRVYGRVRLLCYDSRVADYILTEI